MPFEFKQASCVAVGTFNIYIFRPDWVGEFEDCPEKSEVSFDADFSQPGFKLASDQFGSEWIVRPDRLLLQPRTSENNSGRTLAAVIRKLPFTPLRAVGSNVSFESDVSELRGLSVSALEPISAPDPYEVSQRTWHMAARKGDEVFNLQLSVQDEKALLSANVHTDVKGKAAGFAAEAAERFLEHRRESVALFESILGAKISHE